MRLTYPIVAFAALLAACDRPAPASAPTAQAPAAPSSQPAPSGIRMAATSSPETTARTAFESAVREGMGYADFRSRILGMGWSPVADPQCKANVVGDPSTCEGNADLALCRACDEIPELSSYSSDGRSLSRFRHTDGTQVSVFGLGELKYWNEPGDDPGLALTGWSFDEEGAPKE